ncbi:class I SAM-dependent methyltransferase [Rhizobium sp.]|uniref:class I SAM-dependent methyltransferase n=1 Tax=Rhizobium sp. TaxID=391 RepID=UPI00389A7D72
MSLSYPEPASYRDPSGRIFYKDGRVLRTVTEYGRYAYEKTRGSSTVWEAVNDGRIIDSTELNDADELCPTTGDAYILEHPRIPFISYPYEWSFRQLQAAAVHHLDLQIELLSEDIALSDASAYNVQFVGSKPILIDRLSLVPYQPGQLWLGHRQFCEQFLNPLLLRSLTGIPHNDWFRGSSEGIPTKHIASLVPFRKLLSWNILSHVVLPSKLDAKSLSAPDAAIARVNKKPHLSRLGYEGLLRQLRNWIFHLRPKNSKTTWGTYAEDNTYSDDEAVQKSQFISEFSSAVRPNKLIDLGCNTGNYSIAALQSGASYVIGFDFDQTALDRAFSKAREANLNFLPLWLDAANPSPRQGWDQSERSGFSDRSRVDAVIALAFEHHLSLAKNIPLKNVVDWVIDIAPEGIIEFVPKDDKTVQRMLALRDDIFSEYSIEAFRNFISERATIVTEKTISKSGRTLFWFSRYSYDEKWRAGA